MDSVDTVEAHMLTGDNVTVISMWCHGMVVEEIDALDPEQKFPALNVQCGEEVKRASLGDWVVKYKDKTFDVKKTMEFLHKYRAA